MTGLDAEDAAKARAGTCQPATCRRRHPMSTPDQAAIERFMKGQVACWNGHDRDGFMALYREMATESLDIEYVGQPHRQDGWFVIEEMWDKHNDSFELGVATTIYNGNEAAVHHHNTIRATGAVIESIETYKFEPGKLSIRYFLKPPSADSVDLTQFRGFND